MLCTQHLTLDDLDQLRDAVSEDYYFQVGPTAGALDVTPNAGGGTGTTAFKLCRAALALWASSLCSFLRDSRQSRRQADTAF